jgi:O-antigen/teichoic acid export membrane protein
MTLSAETAILKGDAPLPIKVTQSAIQPTSAPPSLRRNAGWIIGGNSVYAATQWMQVAVVARFGTSTEVGQYALAMGICAPVFMLFNLQLRQIQATDQVRRHTFGEYLALRLATSAGAILVIAVIILFSEGLRRLAMLTALISIFKGIESISDVYQGLLQQSEQMDRIAHSSMLRGCLVMVAFAAIYISTHSLVWAATGVCVAQLLSLYFYDMRAGYSALSGLLRFRLWRVSPALFNPQWEAPKLRELAFRALPLGITMMLLSLYANLPRFVLERYVGAAGVGIFAAMTYLSGIGSMLVTAVGIGVCPRLAQYARSDRRSFRLLLIRMTVLAGMVGLLGIGGSALFGEGLLRTLYGAQYADQKQILVWCMIAAAVGYLTSVLGTAATALNRFREQPLAMAIATAVLLGTSVYLVPRYQIEGAAMATVAASFACLCGYVVILFRKQNERF